MNIVVHETEGENAQMRVTTAVMTNDQQLRANKYENLDATRTEIIETADEIYSSLSFVCKKGTLKDVKERKFLPANIYCEKDTTTKKSVIETSYENY